MQKDVSYHMAAIKYNEELAEFAEALSGRLQHEEVARWSRAVAKQHRFHAGRHKKALSKIEEDGKSAAEEGDPGYGPEDQDLKDLSEKPIEEQQAEYAAAYAAKHSEES